MSQDFRRSPRKAALCRALLSVLRSTHQGCQNHVPQYRDTIKRGPELPSTFYGMQTPVPCCGINNGGEVCQKFASTVALYAGFLLWLRVCLARLGLLVERKCCVLCLSWLRRCLCCVLHFLLWVSRPCCCRWGELAPCGSLWLLVNAGPCVVVVGSFETTKNNLTRFL